MLRTIALILVNEFRLLLQDRIALFMLLLAPIVIIAVAGFSLGNIYGAKMAPHSFTVPLVNDDHGIAAKAIADALAHEPAITVVNCRDLDAARTIITTRDRAPLAIVVPAGTTAALAAGHSASLVLYVDPIKRLEVSAIEFRIAELCQRITAAAQDRERVFVLTPIPGILQWTERSATGSATIVNSFDQYVPGFGITFLLIGMLMGVSLGLIDERDWGTLARQRVSGAPLAGTLIGKLLARFLVGTLQMVMLLAAGYLLFDMSLGRNPAALLMPAAAISFAAAAFGLIIACIARTHDSVMPFGAVVAMAMSAIGGCWWPLDFEPAWMRAFARFLPTTWTMLAFNNLMIRSLPPASALWPSLATVGLGAAFFVAGLFGASRLYD